MQTYNSRMYFRSLGLLWGVGYFLPLSNESHIKTNLILFFFAENSYLLISNNLREHISSYRFFS